MGAVKTGALHQGVGYALHVLGGKVYPDGESYSDVRDQDSQLGIVQAHLVDDDEQRNHDALQRHENSDHVGAVNPLRILVVYLGEGKTAHEAECQNCNGCDCRVDDAVDYIDSEMTSGPGLGIVLPEEGLRESQSVHLVLLACLEGVDGKPEKRCDCKDCEQDQQGIGDDHADFSLLGYVVSDVTHSRPPNFFSTALVMPIRAKLMMHMTMDTALASG